MRILQINTADKGGGAEGSAYNLFARYRQLGHQSLLAVGTKYRDDADICQIPRIAPEGNLPRRLAFLGSRLAARLELRSFPGARKLTRVLSRLSSARRCREYSEGLDETDFPGCSCLLEILPFRPDVVHIHNMHGWYFDMGILPGLSRAIPTILNLRDTWALTGHCAYFMDCEKWRSGCGDCPRLGVYPALRRDGTAQNWKRKAEIYHASKLYVTAPSQWLLDCARDSMLSAVEYRVIPNGIDTGVFCPGDRRQARERLGLPQDVPLLMFASAAAKTVFKDQATLCEAVRQVASANPSVHFLCVGADIGLKLPAMHRFPYVSSPSRMADCYRAADLFLHTARAEAFGKTVTEAMACGTPAVASAVGGLAEQILPGETGYLAHSREEHWTHVLNYLALPDEERLKMGRLAARRGAQFSLERQTNAFLAWYQEILDKHQSCTGTAGTAGTAGTDLQDNFS